MVSRTCLLVITLTSLLGVSTSDFAPIYFPGPTSGQQSIVRDKHSISFQELQQKESDSKTAPTDLLSSLRFQNLLNDNIPKQQYSPTLDNVEGFPNSDVQQSPNNPVPIHQFLPNTWTHQSPKIPNNGYQQYPYTNSQQSPIIPNAGFQQQSNIPNVGYQQFPYIPYTGYQPFPYRSSQQSSFIPNSLYQQPPNTGFQYYSKSAYPGYQQFLNTGFQQSPNIADSGYQRSPSTGFHQLLNTETQQNLNFGFQEVPKSNYPQIYKVDHLIVVVNPPQPQPCVPQTHHTPEESSSGQPDELVNRIGDEGPSKCTWAIVACCSPENSKVRYNCFELLGCPGFFFDSSPCEPKMVEAAAAAALDYYRGAHNGTSSATNTNTI